MKKGGGINTQFGNCDFGETNLGKEGNMITYNKNPITTGKFLNETGQELPTLKKICQDKTNQDTITFLINDGQNKRMTSKDLIEKYPYYTPDGKDKFKYDIDINGATITLSKKPIINMKKTFSSMFSIFKKNK
jgi:hypothetical protein